MRSQLAWWASLVVGLVAQTVWLPAWLPEGWTPDATRGLVIWAALTGLPRGGPLLAFVAGLALDAVTGGPLGFAAVLRLGLYGISRMFRGVFFDDRPLLLLPFAALGGLADAVGAGLLSWVALPHPFPAQAVVGLAWRQGLADALLVPLIFLMLEFACRRQPGASHLPTGIR